MPESYSHPRFPKCTPTHTQPLRLGCWTTLLTGLSAPRFQYLHSNRHIADSMIFPYSPEDVTPSRNSPHPCSFPCLQDQGQVPHMAYQACSDQMPALPSSLISAPPFSKYHTPTSSLNILCPLSSLCLSPPSGIYLLVPPLHSASSPFRLQVGCYWLWEALPACEPKRGASSLLSWPTAPTLA